MRSLNAELVNLETTFQRNTMTNESLYQVPASTLANIPPEVWAPLPQGQGGDASLVTLSTEPRVCNSITRMCPDPRVREFAYTQVRRCD